MQIQSYSYVDFSAVTACVSRYVGNYYGYPEYNQNHELPNALRDSLSHGQLYSKLRVVDMLNYQPKKWTRGAFIGHWHGLLPRLLWAHNTIQVGRGIELSSFWSEFSTTLNSDWDWQSSVGDINSGDWPLDDYDLIVNTSCEHMDDGWLNQVPSGAAVCAQSTDYRHPTHINSVSSLEQLAEKFHGYHIVDTNNEIHQIYSRYTVLAVKI